MARYVSSDKLFWNCYVMGNLVVAESGQVSDESDSEQLFLQHDPQDAPCGGIRRDTS